MDIRKFAQIVLKDVRLLLLDRGTLAIIILTPLMLTIILAAAFSGLSSGDSPVKDIPVVVVNGDQGATLGTQKVNFGQNVSDALKSVTPLLKVMVLTDPDAAKAQVRQGNASAAVLIPADFSQSLNVLNPSFGDTRINVTLFRDAGSPLNADIVASVVKQIVDGFANVDIALNAANKTSNNPLLLALESEGIATDITAKLTGGNAPLTTVSATPANSSTPSAPASAAPSLLTFFAPAMAVFFLNFATAFGAVSIIEERDNGTLQRLLVAPTTRMTILAGKLGGTYITGVIQLSVLIIATTLIGPLVGSTTPVWGSNIPALILLVLVVVAGSVGMGTLLAGVARTRQQASVYISAVMILLGLLGGSFFGPGDPGPLARITVNYWATSAFFKLAQTNDLSSVLPNIVALLIICVVGFAAGVYLFNRRLSV